MRIAIGSDHGGYELKKKIIEFLTKRQIEYSEFGCMYGETYDYPDAAVEVCNYINNNKVSFGILICSTGIGINIAANKICGIRGALCSDKYSAQMAREHNDANVLCLGSRIIDSNLAIEIVNIFLDTKFSDELRHKNRIQKISELEHRFMDNEGVTHEV